MAARRQINPAFASAHGLTAEENEVSSPTGQEPSASSSSSSSGRIQILQNQACHSGNLHAANCGLTSPLPDELFDLRKGSQVDLSLNRTNAPGSHAEETLKLVDFSDNCLGGSLDPRILSYAAVQKLRLRRCQLTSVDTLLTSLEHLTVLDLKGNQLQEFCMGCLPKSIRELDLSTNQLVQLSLDGPNVLQLPNLNNLDISENRLTELFNGNINIQTPGLRSLKCNHNQLTELPPACWMTATSTASTLEILDVSHNCIQTTQAPLDLTMLPALQIVQLDFNRISRLIGIPPSVIRLSATHNKLTGIEGLLLLEQDSGKESCLVELLLQDNHISSLDVTSIAKLVQLKKLDLQSNCLKTLPFELGFLPHLQRLGLKGNPLRLFKSSDIGNTATILQILRKRAPASYQPVDTSTVCSSSIRLSSFLVGNKTLNLCQGKEWKELPPQLLEEIQASICYKGITRLVLNQNQLECMDEEWMQALPNLTILEAGNNCLVQLDTLIGSLPNLIELSLPRNRLSNEALEPLVQTPPQWSKTLQVLDISSNRLTVFPPELLAQLEGLRTLNLSGNQLTSVADWSVTPASLETLNLAENAIGELGDLALVLATQSPKLRQLWLQRNDLQKLPLTIGLLSSNTNLQHLDLRGNPQKRIQYAILEKSCAEVVSYLKNRMTADDLELANQKIQMLKASSSQSNPSESDVVVYSPTASSAKMINAEKVDDSLLSTRAPQTKLQVPETNSPIDNNNIIALKSTYDAAPSPRVEAQEDDGKDKSLLLLEELRISVDALALQLENPALSQAKRYALKKNVAMERSKMIREERKLKESSSK
jgi:leucine-rich repeat protein SHOC2